MCVIGSTAAHSGKELKCQSINEQVHVERMWCTMGAAGEAEGQRACLADVFCLLVEKKGLLYISRLGFCIEWAKSTQQQGG